MTAPAFTPRLRFCSDEKPRCIEGHRLVSQQRVTTDGILRCAHTDRLTGLKCDKLIWVALMTFGGSAKVRGTGERIWLVVELSPADASHFTREPMILLERLAHLGHTMPGVDLDLYGGME